MLISVLATFLVRHWSTVIFVTRLVASGDPSALVQDLAALTRVLPRASSGGDVSAKGQTQGQSQGRMPVMINVIIAIPGKMGTTWVGHIAHQLLDGGHTVQWRTPGTGTASRNLMLDSPYPEFGEMLVGPSSISSTHRTGRGRRSLRPAQ